MNPATLRKWRRYLRYLGTAVEADGEVFGQKQCSHEERDWAWFSNIRRARRARELERRRERNGRA